MAHTKQTAKKTSGGMAPCWQIPLLSQQLRLEAAHKKSVKKNTIHLPGRKKATDLEGGVAANIGRESLMGF